MRAYSETFGLPITITNCANNYGPYQFPEKIIPLFTTNALDDKPLPLYASTENRREWIHALDHCTAIEAILERGRRRRDVPRRHRRREEHRGDRRRRPRRARQAREPEDDRARPARPRPPLRPRLVEDPRTSWDGKPSIEFDDGLRQTVEWYAAHRGWWEHRCGTGRRWPRSRPGAR